MEKFRGTGVAVVTPFTKEGKVDYTSLHNIIEHLIQGNVEYLVVLGTTGESVTLTDDEQKAVIETFFEVNKGRLPIVIGVGGNNTRKICQQVEKISHKYKPDGILSVSPYYNKPSQAGIYAHYAAIAQSTELPIILYNVPGRTASNIVAPTTLKLAQKFEHIIAVKEAAGDLVQCMEIIAERPKDFLVISGDDILTLPMIGVGGDGVISVLANAIPLEIGNMVRAALKGDFDKAQKLHYQTRNLMQLAFKEGNPVGIKTMMELKKLGSRNVRLPLVSATENLQMLIKKEMELVSTK